MVLNSDTRLSAILNDVRGYFNPDSNRKKRCIVSYDRFQSFFEETFSKWVVHNQTDFNCCPQKTINISYPNLDERTKHYLDMQ